MRKNLINVPTDGYSNRYPIGQHRCLRVALTGRMCSGKTEIRLRLQKHRRFMGLALADPLKSLAGLAREILLEPDDRHATACRKRVVTLIQALFPAHKSALMALTAWEEEMERHTAELLRSGKPRQFLQQLATERFRGIQEDVWVHHLLRVIPRRTKRVVVDDVRFVNEAEILVQQGWCLIRLEASETDRTVRMLDLYGHVPIEAITHSSETQLDKITCHYSVLNTSQSMDRTWESLLQILVRWLA